MTLNLNDREWKAFYLTGKDMFYIKKCSTMKTTGVDGTDGVFDVVGATSKNNGNVFFANEKYKGKLVGKNTICLIKTGQGSVGDAIYKGNDFIPSNNVAIIKKDNLNKYIGLFIVTLINKGSNRYSYGYIRNEKRISREKIMLPINDDGNPDWKFMEKYSKAIQENKTKEFEEYARAKLKNLEHKDIGCLNSKDWKEFFLKDLFPTIQRGKRLIKNNQLKGSKPYISSTASNNGVDNFISNDKDTRLFNNCLTIANSGSVGSSFYQPYEFIASDHITHLKNISMNRFVYLFIAAQTNGLSEKYNFNREINDTRISREKVMLPVSNDGKPDYEYMEQYMKNLEYKKIKLRGLSGVIVNEY